MGIKNRKKKTRISHPRVWLDAGDRSYKTFFKEFDPSINFNEVAVRREVTPLDKDPIPGVLPTSYFDGDTE